MQIKIYVSDLQVSSTIFKMCSSNNPDFATRPTQFYNRTPISRSRIYHVSFCRRNSSIFLDSSVRNGYSKRQNKYFFKMCQNRANAHLTWHNFEYYALNSFKHIPQTHRSHCLQTSFLTTRPKRHSTFDQLKTLLPHSESSDLTSTTYAIALPFNAHHHNMTFSPLLFLPNPLLKDETERNFRALTKMVQNYVVVGRSHRKCKRSR